MHTIPNLPVSIVREVFASLCALLPAPVSDTDQARADREETAMAAVAAPHPEAVLAGQIVSADFHARDCLRLAVRGRCREMTARDGKRARRLAFRYNETKLSG